MARAASALLTLAALALAPAATHAQAVAGFGSLTYVSATAGCPTPVTPCTTAGYSFIYDAYGCARAERRAAAAARLGRRPATGPTAPRGGGASGSLATTCV